MTIWVRLRRDRDGFAGPPARRAVAAPDLAVLLALACVMVATLGQAGTAVARLLRRRGRDGLPAAGGALVVVLRSSG